MSLIHDMKSKLVQKNVQIVSQNITRVMESVDEFALNIVSSEELQILCDASDSSNVDEWHLTSLASSLGRSVQRTLNNYGFNANFVNVYLKNGSSEIQFDKLPYSAFESCVQYYEDAEIVDTTYYVPMTWVDRIQLRDVSSDCQKRKPYSNFQSILHIRNYVEKISQSRHTYVN